MNKKIVNDFLEYIRNNRRYSSYTVNNYKVDLEDYVLFLGDVSITSVSYEVCKEYINKIYNNYSNKSTLSRKISCLRSLYNYLEEHGYVLINHFKEFKIPKRGRVLPNYLKKKESLDILSNNLDSDKVLDIRNNLILELLYSTGVRVSELVNIKISDINRDDKTIKIMGKGSKERIVIYGKYCEDKLNRYLEDSYHILNKNNSPYLILNNRGFPLSSRYVRDIVDKIRIDLGISEKISPHTFRHTFATDMLSNGADLISVKKLLGHESINTTSVYTHVTNEHIKNIYKMAHPRGKI